MGGSTTQKQQSTSSNTIDPQSMALLQGNYNTAKTNAASLTPYTGQLTAGFTPTQIQAQGQTAGIATAGDPLSGANIQKYENPYTNDVINTTIADQERSRLIANQANDRAATASHAFGGSRSGVINAETNAGYDRNTGGLLAGLNASNYSQAQGAAQTSFQDQIAQAGLLQSVGDSQQAQQQKQFDDAYNAYTQGQQLTLQQQNILNSALGMFPVQQTTNSSGTTKTSSSPGIGSILGGIGSLAMGLGTMGVGFGAAAGSGGILNAAKGAFNGA